MGAAVLKGWELPASSVCAEVQLDGPCESLPTQNSLGFYEV